MSTHRNLAKSILRNPSKFKAFREFLPMIMPEEPKKVITFGKTLVLYRDAESEEYTIPSNIEYINNYAFAARGMNRIRFNENVEYIGDYAFAYNEKIYGMVFPPSLKKIGIGILHKCRLVKLVLPERFFLSLDEFRKFIGDSKIGEWEWCSFSPLNEVVVYVDDIYCKNDDSLEYEWCEGSPYDRSRYKVKVTFRPRSKHCIE